MDDEIHVVATGSLVGSEAAEGTIAAETTSFSGSVEAALTDEASLPATSNLTGSVSTLVVSDQTFSGNLTALNAADAATSATLTLRVGNDGVDGKDGFSPTITVHKNTPTEYVLKVTNADGSYLTPNLYPDLEGLQDIQALVASKVDKDLTNGNYETVDPMTLSTYQKDNSYMYLNAYDGSFRKVSLGEIALQEEMVDRFRTKLHTVEERPDADWRPGDYIFLDMTPEVGE